MICSVTGCTRDYYSIGALGDSWAPLCAPHRQVDARLVLAWVPFSRDELLDSLASVLTASRHLSGLRSVASLSTVGIIPVLRGGIA